MTCKLLQGDIPAGFDPAIDFERLFDVLTNRESAGLFARRLRLSESTQINHEVVQFFARHGEAVLATNCLGELVRNGNLEALYELAIQEADSGNAEQAGQLLEMVWNQAKSSGRSYGRARFQDADTLIAMKALVAQWLGARRAGNADLETRLFDQIRLTMCSPSTEFGDAIAEHLSQHGAEELAKRSTKFFCR